MGEAAQASEDREQTLLYVDMLGFAELTEKNPTRVIYSSDPETYFSTASTGPIQERINAFYSTVDDWVFRERAIGELQAMLFSDCAFIAAGNALRVALIAVGVMRECVARGVPVRMGIGKGTFYQLEFSTEVTTPRVISRCRFVGTAAVRAHKAERCGGKGMRIFLHSSLEGSDRQLVEGRIKVLPVPMAYHRVSWELDYLYEQKPAGQHPSAEEEDRKLFDSVARMQADAPSEHLDHYIETLEALNRMCKANNRSEQKL